MSDDHIGVKVNGVLYVKLEDARKLREGWDKADKRIAELEGVLRKAKQHFVADEPLKAFVEICAALGGKKDE